MPGIVITGTGLAVNLGLSPGEVWEGMAAGRSALGPMPALEQRPVTDKGGGQAAELPAEYRPDLDRAARYLRYVAEQALQSRDREGATARESSSAAVGGTAAPQSGRAVAPHRLAVVMGTTLHGMRAGGEALRSGDLSRLRGFLAGSVLHDALGDLGFTGPMLTTCSACSSGLGSVALGATLLRTGQADRVIAGGYDSVSEYSYAGFDALGLIAVGAPRPFAKDRDGMKVAEGYAAMVLERAEEAAARGAEVLAVLAGHGETSDSFHLTQPQPEGEGAARAIRAALADAGLDAGAIDLIIAHATATPNNDAAEHAALAAILGERVARVSVAALKSHLGHTLGGAGAVELVLAVEALRRQQAPPTAGEYAPEFGDVRLVGGRPEDRPLRHTINLSLGFGGANACVVLSRGGNEELRHGGPRRATEEGETETAGGAGAARVVITGIGVVLPGATTLDQLLELVDRGAQLDRDTGPIPEENYQYLVNARRTRRMSEYAKLTVAAATAACRDAGLEPGSPHLADAEAILGTTQGSTNFCEAYYGQIVREGLAAANPALFAEGVPNAAAAHLSMTLGLRGACQTIIGSRRAGLDALALAACRIAEGRWQRAIVSAAEEHSDLVARAYEACGLGRPITGAGAVALVLESVDAAAARGARAHGRLRAWGWPESLSAFRPDTPPFIPVAASLGGLPPDAQLAAACPGRLINVFGPLPELFSAGPLAALACALARKENVAHVVAPGLRGGLSVVTVAAPRTPLPPVSCRLRPPSAG